MKKKPFIDIMMHFFYQPQSLIHIFLTKKLKKTLHIKKCSYLCTPKTEVKTIEKSLQASDFQGEMPEWSIGAVSKTVDQLAGPRVRIPVSPLPKDSRVLNRLMSLFFMSKR